MLKDDPVCLAHLDTDVAGVRATAARRRYNKQKREEGVVVGPAREYQSNAQAIEAAKARAAAICPDSPFLDEMPAFQETPTRLAHVSEDDERTASLKAFAEKNTKATTAAVQEELPLFQQAAE